jgi:hypothetical protein
MDRHRHRPVVVTVHESEVQTHNLLTGAISQLQPDQPELVTALATTNDPARPPAVAIARADHNVAVVDPIAQREICRFALPYAASALAWAPDGLLIIACRQDLHCVQVPAL